MKKILLFTLILSFKGIIFAQTYGKFVVSDLIVKRLTLGVEKRNKVIGLEAIVDFSKPEFLGTKLFDSESKIQFGYGAICKFYLDPSKIKKNQHFIGIIAKNNVQYNKIDENKYKKSFQNIGLLYGLKKHFERNFFYEINLGVMQNFNFRYYDVRRNYEIIPTSNPNPTYYNGSDPFLSLLDSFAKSSNPPKFDYVSILLNCSLTYQF
jgi:hypothetical protein